MVRQSEISSTEKLLDLIRSKKGVEPEAFNTTPSVTSSNDITSEKKGLSAFAQKVTVGVDIDHSDLKLAAISSSSGKNDGLLGYLTVPFPSGISKESPQFQQFLGSSLKKFLASSKKTKIWSAIPSSMVEMRLLKIPKVPKKQISNATFWTYKKEVPFDEKEVIFDFEVLGNVYDEGVEKIGVMAYTASKQAVENLKAVFTKSGFPLAGISILSFGLQNIFKKGWIETKGKGVCSLYVGRDWSRIDIFSANGNLALSREIKTGINSMIDSIREGMSETEEESPLSLVDSEDKAVDLTVETPHLLDKNKAGEIFFNLINESAASIDEFDESDDNAEKVFNPIIFARTIRPVLKRLIRQVERTIGHYSLMFDSDGVGKIIISGEICASPIIVDNIREQLRLPLETFDPFVSKNLSGPGSLSERTAYAPATGLALSSNSLTPNFIFTHKNKEQHQKIGRINRIVLSLFSVLVVLCSAVYLWQNHNLNLTKARYAETEQEINRYAIRTDEQMINDLIAVIKQNKQTVKKQASRHLGMAVLSELADIGHPNIRLLNISALMPPDPASKTKRKKDKRKVKAPKKRVTVKGIVLGTPQTFEADLAGYLIELKDSTLFGPPSITMRSSAIFENRVVLRFTAQMDLVSDERT